jgi:hypothetical protein
MEAKENDRLVGAHSITANYGGNDNLNGCSANTFSQVVK